MPLLDGKTQIITVRLSVEEHERLKHDCGQRGGCSLSGYVRDIIIHRPSRSETTTGLLTTDLATLASGLQELNAAMMTLRKQILALLGPTDKTLARTLHAHPIHEVEGQHSINQGLGS